MANMLAYIGAVRRKCGYYAPQDGPDEGTIAEYALEALDECTTELNLSVPAWILPRFNITVGSGLDEVNITQVGDFGRPYMVLTANLANPSNHDTRVVEIVDESALYRYNSGGDQASSVSVSNNTSWAQAVAFGYKNGSHYMRVAPVAYGTADYKVLYEPETARPTTALDQAFRLPQFDSYITDKVAFRVLPYVKMDAGLKSGIVATLSVTIEEGKQRFNRYRRSDRFNDRVQSIPFGGYRWKRRRR